MELYWRLVYLSLLALLLWTSPSFSASTKTVIADGQYVMADGDTLAGAEEKVLQRAQRNAVEEAGIYLESTFRDVEKESGGRSTQTSSLEIRTIAAAVMETEILESRRSFELDRPVFFVRIRVTVNMSSLAEAIRRLQSDQRLTQHFRQLQQENHQFALTTTRASTAADRRPNAGNRSDRKVLLIPTSTRDARNCSPYIESSGQDPTQHRRRHP